MSMSKRDWDEVYIEQAASDIGEFCRKWGRINVTQCKEKYLTCRVYCSFGHQSLHGLLYPGYVYKRQSFPNWLWSFDVWYISRFLNLFNFAIIPYQRFIYRLAYKRALKKYPQHLRNNILNSSDQHEWLEGL